MLFTEIFWMIKKLVSWLYLKVVYLPSLKAKIEADNPGVRVTYTNKAEDYTDWEFEQRLMRQAWFERERIPNDHLH